VFSKLRSILTTSSNALFPARAPRSAKLTRIFGMTSTELFFSGNAAMGSSTVEFDSLRPKSTSAIASPSTTSPRTFRASSSPDVAFFAETFRRREGISDTGFTLRDTGTAATSSIPKPDSRSHPIAFARALRMNLSVFVSIFSAFSE